MDSSCSPKHGWFDSVAASYAQQRPHYPESLFAWISRKASSHKRCWDVACGSGQASLGLARHFDRVDATDLSPAQVAAAPAHSNIHYQVAAAEDSGLPNACMDAIVVAAAIHWLDVPRFNEEAFKVARPGGLMVWVGYDPPQGAPPALQLWLDQLYGERLRNWWPPQRQHVDNHYQNLPFPAISTSLPQELCISLQWSCDQLIGYIGTWSALRKAKQEGHDLLPQLSMELQRLWPSDQTTSPLIFPLMGRWGYLTR